MKPIARLIGAGNRQPGEALAPSQLTLPKSNSRLWKASCRHRWLVIFSTALALLSTRAPALAEPGNQAVVAPGKYLGLSLSGTAGKVVTQKVLHRYGIPFLAGTLQLPHGGSAQVKVGCRARRIFLLGMTATPRIGCWADPRNQAARCFIGDELGRIELNYADGATETFPLISGESLWWGQTFYRSPGPFPTDATFRKALASALRLYPPSPVKDGNYVAVITPRPIPLRSITFESSAAKWATPIIAGVTFEPIGGTELAGAIALAPQKVPAGFKTFVRTKALRAVGEREKTTQRQLNNLRRSLYSSDRDFFKGRIAEETPRNYSGPEVSFQGDRFAQVLAKVFEFNLQDMADKMDPNGMYHTSTQGALLWGFWGPNDGQFGTYATNVGLYYNGSWGRDLGRSLQELTVLGYTNDAERCADYCLRMAKLWEKPPAPKVDGKFYPPHWSRIVNHPQNAPAYENDAHGLISMFLYRLWQRLPDHDDWLRARWPGVKAAGDWILWQFAHPEISGATNGILHTTGECAHGNGYSVYADAVCMEALDALAQMADSIGQTHSARQWRDRAEKMRQAITDQYIVTDPKYGRVWTLKDAGWPNQSTVLGPLIFQADDQGFAPEDSDREWRAVNAASYHRLIDTYNKPPGFYGWAMGYGQGFVTQAALLLDRMHEATQMLDWTAKEIYDPRYGSFIVPEGVQLDPSGRFWYRAGDLGNGVQEAEIVKTLRLMLGVDDTHPDRLQFYPRMPCGWRTMAVDKYPVLFESGGKTGMARLRYKLKRSGERMKLEISADGELGPVAMRLGPFAERPSASSVRVNGKIPERTFVEHSGDSWWVRFSFSIPRTEI